MNIDVLFSNPHGETWQNVCFFVRVFLSFWHFLQFFVIFLHQGQIMYIEMLYATDRPSGMLTWNSIEYLSGKPKKNQTASMTEILRLKKWLRKRSIDQTTCSCAWNGIHHYFWSNKMHAQTVCSVTETTRIHRRGQDFFEYNMYCFRLRAI